MSSFFSTLKSTVNAAIDQYAPTARKTFQFQDTQLRCKELLGQGGFSQVYLAEDTQHELYAVKEMPCRMSEQLAQAQREVAVQSLFQHKHIVPVKYSAVVDDVTSGGKNVLIALPFYERGTLQDLLEAYHTNSQSFKERQIYRLFLDISRALETMHTYNGPGLPRTKEGQGVPWAHNDIKPGNIVIADNGKPLLMDFGSAAPAIMTFTNKQQAKQCQERAEQHSSMPYRSPELMSVEETATLDAKVDVWSLGCTVFAMAYGASPFEYTIEKQGGGSLSLAILNGKVSFPAKPSYSDQLKDLISWMLTVNAQQRPNISQVIDRLEALLVK
ncbi:NAK/MPSK protein kinase [Gongronella butleri]|nr:NAK/MPSK protein kinase [Gongronella butleri]